MWGAVVRNCREWIRLVSVFFPRELLPPAMAYVQARPVEPERHRCQGGRLAWLLGGRHFVEAAMGTDQKSFGLDGASSMWGCDLSTHVGMNFLRILIGEVAGTAT